MVNEKLQVRKTHKDESSEATLRGGLTRSSEQVPVMGVERRGQPGAVKLSQPEGRSSKEQTKKRQVISQLEVKQAWLRVRSKGGKGGVDRVSLVNYEDNLRNNLYKLWNRMNSGSYHPQGVLRVEIPKGDGKMRPLGIPTIQDRVAQEVVRAKVEPELEKIFHPSSYGFRPKRCATEAVGKCRGNCWKYDWVLDLDIQKFFDTIDHELLMRAVEKHVKEGWILRYIRRWLTAPIEHTDGRQEENSRGTPQGGVISPLLANLYLHYVFDRWMDKNHPDIKFERYADDIVIHCKSQEESEYLREKLTERFEECKLELHPEKTKVVYCKDGKRKGSFPTKKFKFLGYTYESRSAENKKTGETFNSFLPAVSNESAKKFRDNIKKSKILKQTQQDLEATAKELNPKVRGWYNYFKNFYRSALMRTNDWLDMSIANLIKRKYRISRRRAFILLKKISETKPSFLAHWNFRTPGRAV